MSDWKPLAKAILSAAILQIDAEPEDALTLIKAAEVAARNAAMIEAEELYTHDKGNYREYTAEENIDP